MTDDPTLIQPTSSESECPRQAKRTQRLSTAAAVAGLAALVALIGAAFGGGTRSPSTEAVGSAVSPDSSIPGPDATLPRVQPRTTPGVFEGRITPFDGVRSPAVTRHDPGPLSARSDAAIIPLGRGRVVVWGGDMEGPNFGRPDLGWEQFVDGAVFDSLSQRWTMMAPTDLLPAIDWNPVGVHTGTEVLIWRRTDGAAWNPETGAWRPLPAAPAPVTHLGWDGSVAVALGADARFDPATNTWAPLPGHAVLDESLVRSATWSGDRWFVAAGRSPQVASIGGAGEWVEHASPNFSASVDWLNGTWHDGQLILASWHELRALDSAADTWSSIPPPPTFAWKLQPDLVSSDAALAAISGGSISLWLGDRWKVIPQHEPTRPRASGGRQIWVHGLDVDRQPTMQSIDLERIRNTQVEAVGAIPILVEAGMLTPITPDRNAQTEIVTGIVDLSGLGSCAIDVGIGTPAPVPIDPEREATVRMEDDRWLAIECEQPDGVAETLRRLFVDIDR